MSRMARCNRCDLLEITERFDRESKRYWLGDSPVEEFPDAKELRVEDGSLDGKFVAWFAHISEECACPC